MARGASGIWGQTKIAVEINFFRFVASGKIYVGAFFVGNLFGHIFWIELSTTPLSGWKYSLQLKLTIYDAGFFSLVVRSNIVTT